MSDLISRKAAIEKIVSLKRERNPLTETDRAMNYILEVAESCIYYLPSAKPVVKDTNVPYSDTISRQTAIDAIEESRWERFTRGDYFQVFAVDALEEATLIIKQLPSAQQEIIRCKDCKHKPFDGKNGRIEFPVGSKCPCKCEDDYYDWKPDADWFCGCAERRAES